MTESAQTISRKAGLHPGALIHVGQRKTDRLKISLITYDADKFSSSEYESFEDCKLDITKGKVTWLNIDGLHNIDEIAKIGDHFGLHPLLLEDVLNTRHRPKVEEFDNCLFITLKMLGINDKGSKIVSEQVSFVLGDSWVLSFQEQEGDIFEGLRERLKKGMGNTRKKGNDYLLYRLVDTIVDHYFFVTEHVSEATEALEETVQQSADTLTLQEIQGLKKQLINLKKSIYPLREAILILQRGDSKLIKQNTIRYLRDVYEHIIQVIDSIEAQRDMLSSIMDLYHSVVSHKMNQVMQVLTIIATIFIPLTFVAGIYGMNFANMPELQWKYGYFAVWGIMLVLVLFMIRFFKKKNWL